MITTRILSGRAVPVSVLSGLAMNDGVHSFCDVGLNFEVRLSNGWAKYEQAPTMIIRAELSDKVATEFRVTHRSPSRHGGCDSPKCRRQLIEFLRRFPSEKSGIDLVRMHRSLLARKWTNTRRGGFNEMWLGEYLVTREDHSPMPQASRPSWWSAITRLPERLLCALFGAR
jgi:hypothetical protein